jgi:hypothetical protein
VGDGVTVGEFFTFLFEDFENAVEFGALVLKTSGKRDRICSRDVRSVFFDFS